MIVVMVDAGHAGPILLSSDFAIASSLWKTGGAGPGQTATVFGPTLLKAGMPDGLLREILVDNPLRLLAFIPR